LQASGGGHHPVDLAAADRDPSGHRIALAAATATAAATTAAAAAASVLRRSLAQPPCPSVGPSVYRIGVHSVERARRAQRRRAEGRAKADHRSHRHRHVRVRAECMQRGHPAHGVCEHRQLGARPSMSARQRAQRIGHESRLLQQVRAILHAQSHAHAHTHATCTCTCNMHMHMHATCTCTRTRTRICSCMCAHTACTCTRTACTCTCTHMHMHRAFEPTHHPGEARADGDRVEVHATATMRAGRRHRGDRAYLSVAAVVAVHEEHGKLAALRRSRASAASAALNVLVERRAASASE